MSELGTIKCGKTNKQTKNQAVLLGLWLKIKVLYASRLFGLDQSAVSPRSQSNCGLKETFLRLLLSPTRVLFRQRSGKVPSPHRGHAPKKGKSGSVM